MKSFLFDTFMLIVWCLLFVICIAIGMGLEFIVIWIIYQIAEFGNFSALLLLFVFVVGLAIFITMVRFTYDFWLTYC